MSHRLGNIAGVSRTLAAHFVVHRTHLKWANTPLLLLSAIGACAFISTRTASPSSCRAETQTTAADVKVEDDSPTYISPRPSKWWRKNVFEILSTRRITGNYENRLKATAAPEKIFEYFANDYDATKKTLYMSKNDFFDSLIFYTFFPRDDTVEIPPSPINQPNVKGSLDSKADLFSLADADGDGRLSFEEYLFFLTLLATSQTDFELAFRLLGSGTHSSPSVNAQEFELLMSILLRDSPKSGKYKSCNITSQPDGIEEDTPGTASTTSTLKKGSGMSLPDGRSVSTTASARGVSFHCLSGPLGEGLFGENRKSSLLWSDFQGMLWRLKEEVLFVEFVRAGTPKGRGKDTRITAGEFARVLVGFVEPREMEALADRIRQLEFDQSKSVSFGEFLSFHECIRRIHALKAAVRLKCNGGGMTRECLRATLGALTECPNTDFSDLVEVVFKVFDVDGNGKLDEAEFLSLVQQRRIASPDIEVEGRPGIYAVAKKIWSKFA